MKVLMLGIIGLFFVVLPGFTEENFKRWEGYVYNPDMEMKGRIIVVLKDIQTETVKTKGKTEWRVIKGKIEALTPQGEKLIEGKEIKLGLAITRYPEEKLVFEDEFFKGSGLISGKWNNLPYHYRIVIGKDLSYVCGQLDLVSITSEIFLYTTPGKNSRKIYFWGIPKDERREYVLFFLAGDDIPSLEELKKVIEKE